MLAVSDILVTEDSDQMANTQVQALIEQLKKQRDLLDDQINAAEKTLQALSKAGGASLSVATKKTAGKATANPLGGRPAIHATCTIPGCGKPHQAKGLCSGHYQEQRRAALRAKGLPVT